MGATLATERIFDAFRGGKERALYYGHTFCGYPLGAALAREVLAIYREEEREMIPFCIDDGVACVPYSPLASGLLARQPNEQPCGISRYNSNARSFYAGRSYPLSIHFSWMQTS